MRILVIGGTRFIGPHVVARLCDAGHQVAVFNRGKTRADLPDQVERIVGDRQELAIFAEPFERFAPQVVLDMIPITGEQARDVVDVFAGIARRVVAVSSQDVYRAYGKLIGLESGPVEPLPLREDAPLRQKLYPYREQSRGPDDFYYHYDKILVERAVMSAPALAGTILRLPMVYGPRDGQHRTFEHLKRMDDARPAILLGEGLARWRWTRGYVENVAEAISLAVTDERAAGRVYNVGEGEALTTAEWVAQIGRAAGWQGRVVVVPDERLPAHLKVGLNVDQHLVADTGRLRRELGYREPVSREEGLRRTVAWQRAHPPARVDAGQFDYAAEDALLAEGEG